MSSILQEPLERVYPVIMSSQEKRLKRNFWMGLRRFCPYSPLRVYLDAKYPHEYYLHPDKRVSLYGAVMAILSVCSRENLKCPENEVIILANSSLKSALYVNAFHAYETFRFVQRQLQLPIRALAKDPAGCIPINQEIIIRYDPANADLQLPQDIDQFENLNLNIHRVYQANVPGRFSANTREFAECMETVPGFYLDAQNSNTFCMWVLATVQYMNLFRLTYHDEKNKTIIHCRNSILGRTFKVPVFHVSQLGILVLKGLHRTDLPFPNEIATASQFMYHQINRFSTATSANGESSSNEEKETETAETGNDTKQKKRSPTQCLQCFKDISAKQVYCDKCWNRKKNWRITQYRKKKLVETDFSNVPVCCLCLTARCNTVFVHKTSCHYIACYQCAKEWWNSSESKACPKCRKRVLNFCKLYS